MSFKPGDLVTFFPAKHPKKPKDAVFVNLCGVGGRARIELIESGKTVLCGIDSIQLTQPAPKMPHHFMPAPGFKSC